MSLLRAPGWIRAFAAGAGGLLLAACMFGTGTDTENGLGVRDPGYSGPVSILARVTDTGGMPVRGVEMRLHTPAFRPDFIGPDSAQGYSGDLWTDANGEAVMKFQKPGVYVVSGQVLGMSLFVDTVRVLYGATDGTEYFRAMPPSPLHGNVRMLSGFKVESGMVFVRGTDLLARVGQDGNYDFGLVSASVFRMAFGVRYTATPKVNNYVLVKPDSAKPGQVNLVAGPNGYCLDTPPPGSSGSMGADSAFAPVDSVLAEAARKACAGHTGSLVQVNVADSSGASKPAGVFVIPDTSRIQIRSIIGYPPVAGADYAIKNALPATCIPNGNEVVSFETFLLTGGGEMQVNDVSGAVNPACQE